MSQNTPAAWAEQAALLEQAAAFPHASWIQGIEARNAAGEEVYSFAQDAAGFCAAGRLYEVCRQAQVPWDTRLSMFIAVLEQIPEAQGNLAEWNDAPGRTAAEVEQLFHQAAAQLRRKSQAA